MRVLRLYWLGVPTHAYDALLGVLRDVVGMRVEFEQPSTTEPLEAVGLAYGRRR
jgi:hypothetical protein